MPDDTPFLARLAYEAYCHALALSMPLPWERLPLALRLAWGVVVDVVRCHKVVVVEEIFDANVHDLRSVVSRCQP